MIEKGLEVSASDAKKRKIPNCSATVTVESNEDHAKNRTCPEEIPKTSLEKRVSTKTEIRGRAVEEEVE